MAAAYCRSTRAQAIVAAAASLGAMVLFTRTQSLGDHQSLILAPFYLLMLFGLCAKLTQQKGKALAAQCCGGCSGRIFGGQLRQRPASAR